MLTTDTRTFLWLFLLKDTLRGFTFIGEKKTHVRTTRKKNRQHCYWLFELIEIVYKQDGSLFIVTRIMCPSPPNDFYCSVRDKTLSFVEQKLNLWYFIFNQKTLFILSDVGLLVYRVCFLSILDMYLIFSYKCRV